MTPVTTSTLAVLSLLGACAAPATVPDTAQPEAARAAIGPDCRLERDGGTWRAIVAADAAVSGSYALDLSRPGLSMRQDGPFSAAAGETLLLGEATVGDVPGASLSITVGGRTRDCPIER
ncbi:curli-like amyloid fiber formation chaperone CsgH [Wenxinia marina]|uniref:Membrane-bound lysozyme-inhibitor of c-type lysozyme n=1 Tax=Wenxinia marina DSM 24838 TaxID=1123501 RepID=A0A0D0QA84_9RHOB|nr:curli-like amyloid fiber formation chaperone CsgH [Wenxinia marina]KIQ69207.1 hypothetical protein Wenmar_02278 [Wenxinia marina DSM 24838]GGL71160.1 hypothetical protein GCM10011392_27160 [Wenxinia marina]